MNYMTDIKWPTMTSLFLGGVKLYGIEEHPTSKSQQVSLYLYTCILTVYFNTDMLLCITTL